MKTLQIFLRKSTKRPQPLFVRTLRKLSDEDKKIQQTKQLPTYWRNVSSYFSEFCSSTSIHGVKYVGERGRFMVERIIWSVLLAIVGYFCISLILKTYGKWKLSPVIVTFATTETSISEIPFPAITICPEVKCDPEIFNYTDVLYRLVSEQNITKEEAQYFETLSLICDGIGADLTKAFIPDLNLTVDRYSLLNFIKVLPDTDNFNLSGIKWLQEAFNEMDMLSETFTSAGLCYSFNMLDFEEILVTPEEYATNHTLKDTKTRRWTLEDGYPDSDKMDTFPRRTFVPGIRGGFMYDMLTNHSHLDYICGESLQGYKVTLHHPSELPDMDKHFWVPLDQAVYVGIKPRMITVSESLKHYRPEDRKCYFTHERRLSYFKIYTQNNCLDECFSNYTLEECGCLAFYMPNHDSSPICGPGSIECLETSKVNYLSNYMGKPGKSQEKSSCACLPSCTSLEYDVEISQIDWNWKEVYYVFTRFGYNHWPFDFEKMHVTKLVVFYKEMQFLSTVRNELYDYVTFFSNTGGLLGLFIGFSVTSGIEILYFLTLRLICNIRKFGRNFWAGRRLQI